RQRPELTRECGPSPTGAGPHASGAPPTGAPEVRTAPPSRRPRRLRRPENPMDTTTQKPAAPPTPGPSAPAGPPPVRGATRPGDRIYLGLARGSGIFVLVVMAAIAAFLTYRASKAIGENEANF